MNIERRHIARALGAVVLVLATGCASTSAQRQDQAIRTLSDFRGWHVSRSPFYLPDETPYHDARIQAVGQRCLRSYLSGVGVIDHQIAQPDVNLASRSRTLKRASAAARQLDRRLQRCTRADNVTLELAVVTGAGIMSYGDWLAALADAFERTARLMATLDVDRRIELPLVTLAAHQAGRIGEDSYFALGEFQELGLPPSAYPAPAFSP